MLSRSNFNCIFVFHSQVVVSASKIFSREVGISDDWQSMSTQRDWVQNESEKREREKETREREKETRKRRERDERERERKRRERERDEREIKRRERERDEIIEGETQIEIMW